MASEGGRKLEGTGGSHLGVRRFLGADAQKHRRPAAEHRAATSVEMDVEQANDSKVSGSDSQLTATGAFGRFVGILLVRVFIKFYAAKGCSIV